ncbi:hypothetical protein ACO0QE_003053 [Hanseniaspora vineae]
MDNYRASSNNSGNYTTIAYNNNMMIRRRAEQRVTWSIQEDIDLLTTILTNKEHIGPSNKDGEKIAPTDNKQVFSSTPVAPIPVSRSSSFSAKVLNLPGAENNNHSSSIELAANQAPSPKSGSSLSLADPSLITSPNPLTNSTVTPLSSAESASAALGEAATSSSTGTSNTNPKTTRSKKKNMFWNIVSEDLKKYSTIHHHTRNKRQCKDRFALLYWKKYYSVSTFFNESKNKNLDAELQKCLMMDVDDFLSVLEARFDLNFRGDVNPESAELVSCNNGYDERSNTIDDSKPSSNTNANDAEQARQSSTNSIVKSENEFESDHEHKNSFYKKKNSTGGKSSRVSKGHHILNILLMYIYLHFEFNGSSALKVKAEPGLEQKKIWNSSFENSNEPETFVKTENMLLNDQKIETSHTDNEIDGGNHEKTDSQQFKEYIKKLENDVAILNNIVSKQATHIKALKTELNSYKSASSLAPSMPSSVSSSDRSASNNTLWGGNPYYYHPYNAAPSSSDGSMSYQGQQQQRSPMPHLVNQQSSQFQQQQQQQQRPIVPGYAPQYTNMHYKNSMPELRHQSRSSSLANIVVQASSSTPTLNNPLSAVQHNQSMSNNFNNNNNVHNRNSSFPG